jgi:RimJ/RimL family protein N-acetyltransferase
VYRFYVIDSHESSETPVVSPGLTVRFWRPSLSSVPPAGLRNATHWTWWCFHVLHIFANRDFGVVMIERDGRLVHRSGVFPRFFRFPFMTNADLQIGDTWTAPDQRRQGLASLAIDWALHELGQGGRRVWYVVEDSNEASVRVIEKRGFRLAGTGSRLPRLRLRALGYYAITHPA